MWNECAHACGSDIAVVPPDRCPTELPSSPYRDERRALVLWIANKANRFRLKTLTIHYAANYLDRCDCCSLLPVVILTTSLCLSHLAACRCSDSMCRLSSGS